MSSKNTQLKYAAIGVNSGMIYATGAYRSEVFKNLKSDYPYTPTMSGKRVSKRNVYIEPLVIRQGYFEE